MALSSAFMLKTTINPPIIPITTAAQGATKAQEAVIVGSATSLIVQYDGSPHTWEEVAMSLYMPHINRITCFF